MKYKDKKISVKTLNMIDTAILNLSKGIVGEPIDFSKFPDIFKEETLKTRRNNMKISSFILISQLLRNYFIDVTIAMLILFKIL